jgi:hypothetical protein
MATDRMTVQGASKIQDHLLDEYEDKDVLILLSYEGVVVSRVPMTLGDVELSLDGRILEMSAEEVEEMSEEDFDVHYTRMTFTSDFRGFSDINTIRTVTLHLKDPVAYPNGMHTEVRSGAWTIQVQRVPRLGEKVIKFAETPTHLNN